MSIKCQKQVLGLGEALLNVYGAKFPNLQHSLNWPVLE